jgi:acylglycerol lipase
VSPGNPKAVLIFFHGYGSWTGKYGYYAKYFAEAGYDVVGYDLRGFGKTEQGVRGHLRPFDEQIDEAYSYCVQIRKVYSADIPLGLLGYSMGGAISIILAIKFPDLIHNLILNAPFIAFTTPSGKLPYHRDASAIAKFYPDMRVLPVPPCSLLGFMQPYFADPLQLKRGFSAQAIEFFSQATDFILSHSSLLKTQFHATIGELDTIISKAHFIKVMNESPADKRELVLYPFTSHFMLSDGLHLETYVKAQLEFLS